MALRIPELGHSRGIKGFGQLLSARLDSYLLLVILLPFAILSFYKSWIITVACYLDPWYSLGYFLSLGETVRLARDYYVSSRLACWLPGAAVYALLPCMAANYVLRLAYFWLAAVSMYLILKKLFDRNTAVLTTCMLGTYWHFLHEVGWNYVDGAGIAYYLLTLCLVTTAGGSRQRRWLLLLAGASFAAVVNSNLFLLTTAPLVALVHCVLNGTRDKRRLFDDALIFSLGFALLLGLLNAIYYGLSGSVIAFWSQITAALSIYQHQGSTVGMLGYEVPSWQQWVPEAHWLKVPFAVFVSSVIYLGCALKWERFRNRAVILFQVLYLCQCLGMAYLQLNGRVLIIPWYASYLIPNAFLALAALMYGATRSLSRYELLGAILFSLCALAWLFHLPPAGRMARFSEQLQSSRAYGITAIAILVAAVVGLFTIGAHRRVLRALILTLLCSTLAALNYALAYPDARDWKLKKDSFAAICQGIQAIDSARGSLNSLRFWYPMYESPGVYTSLNSVYLWGQTFISRDYPSLSDAPGHKPSPMPPGTTVVVLSKKEHFFEEARELLHREGMDARFVQENRICCGQIAYTLLLMRITDRTPNTFLLNDTSVP